MIQLYRPLLLRWVNSRGSFLLVFAVWQGGADLVAAESPEQEVERLLRHGDEAFQSGEFVAALEAWTEGLELVGAAERVNQEQEAELLRKVGAAHGSLGRAEQAVPFLLLARDLHAKLGDRVGETKDLHNLSYSLRELDRLDEALEYSLAARELVKDINNYTLESQVLLNLGEVWFELGAFERASDAWKESLPILAGASDYRALFSALGLVGDAYEKMSRYEEAIAYYARALDLRQELRDSELEYSALARLALAWFEARQWEEASQYAKLALALGKGLSDPQYQGVLLQTLGLALKNIGQPAEAAVTLTQALKVATEQADTLGALEALINLSNCYLDLAQYGRAEEAVASALQLASDNGLQKHESIALNNLGLVRSRIGDYSAAVNLYERASSLSRGVGDVEGEAAAAFNLGAVLHAQGSRLRAVEHYKQALAVYEDLGDRSSVGGLLHNIGEALLFAKSTEEAERYLRRAIVVGRTESDLKTESSSLASLGLLHFLIGETALALQYYWEALLVGPSQDPEHLWRIYVKLADAYSELGSQEAAIFFGKMAVNAIQSVRIGLREFEHISDEAYLEEKKTAYKILAERMIDVGRLAEAIATLDLFKLKEFTSVTQRTRERDEHLALTQVEKALQEGFTASLSKIGKQLGEYSALASRTSRLSQEQHARMIELAATLDSLRRNETKRLQTLVEGLREREREGERVDSLKAELEALESFQHTLEELDAPGARTMLVYLLTTAENLYVIAAAGKTGWPVVSRESKISEEDFRREIFKSVLVLRNPESKKRKYLESSQFLYQQLLQPLQEYIDTFRPTRLIVYLDGALRYVPLAALHDGERFLVEDYALIQYTPATKDRLGRGTAEASRAAAMGVTKKVGRFRPLPNVDDELDSIVKEGDDDERGVVVGRIYLDEEFTKERLAASLQQDFNVLHLASHFELSPGNPEESFLLLGDGQRLSLADLDSVRFPFSRLNLIALSACQTGFGRRRAAEGSEVESFALMAQYKGADTVLATLWKVDDASTAELMGGFYREWQASARTKAEALRLSQVEFIKKKKQYSHPYYWAGFILLGDYL